MARSRILFEIAALLFSFAVNAAYAGESRPAWEAEWAKTIDLAKKEGQLTISHTRGPFDQVFADFSKRYPDLRTRRRFDLAHHGRAARR
jgi:hypothetical protein